MNRIFTTQISPGTFGNHTGQRKILCWVKLCPPTGRHLASLSGPTQEQSPSHCGNQNYSQAVTGGRSTPTENHWFNPNSLQVRNERWGRRRLTLCDQLATANSTPGLWAPVPGSLLAPHCSFPSWTWSEGIQLLLRNPLDSNAGTQKIKLPAKENMATLCR